MPLVRDLRYAVRNLRRSPAFTAAVVVTLALGIGANTAMFGVVDWLMFRPYPYLRDPSTVHRVYMRWTQRGERRTQSHTEYARFLDIARWTTSFSDHAAFAERMLAVGVGDAARERRVAVVSATFFGFFDAPPALGRYFAPDEDRIPRGANVAVLSHGFWKSAYAGRDVRGERLQVGTVPATIVGVAPEGFSGLNDADPPALYIPITTYAAAEADPRNAATYFSAYNWGWVEIMVRRKPDVSVAQASADASRAHVMSWNQQRETEPSLPAAEIAKPAAVVSAMKLGAGPEPGLEARTALWVSGVAVVVLLIACANVASLFLARALKREREIAVRLALGVSRRRLVTQMLTESLLLSILGTALGLLLAEWGGTAIQQLLIPGGAGLETFIDRRMLAAAAALAISAGVITGIAPALVSGRGDLATSLKAGAREGTYRHSRLRSALLVIQGALSVVLLVGAGLFVKSLDNANAMRLGYDAERVLIATRNLRGMPLNDTTSIALRRSLLATAQAIPGVEYAAWVSSVPFWSTSTTNLYVTGIDSVRPLGEFTYQTATPDYFRVMGTRIIRGRGFAPSDVAGAPRIGVVSAAMAKVLWPGEDALGQCMRVFNDTMPCTTVVGIAEDIVQRDITGPRYHYYLPIDQHRPAGGHSLLLRMRTAPTQDVERVRRSLQGAMPGTSYVTVRALGELVDDTRRSWRLGATMFTAFGLLALVVAAVGMYGTIGYNVALRMHEIGVRIALGAKRGHILQLVVRQGVRLAIAGIVLGSVIGIAASPWLQPLLFEQSATDPVTYATVGIALLVVAIGASVIPAMRAARAQPGVALRSE
ncbi:MAG TPA: ABC transporter permease [Gemmatimonadaceae bacterium]|nr:ABC transporter permease [Gemmatimonadaceae bacterium]